MASHALLAMTMALGLVLAGCSGDPAGDGTDGTQDKEPATTLSPFEAAPQWNVSDYWTFSLSNGDTATSVVTDVGSSEYIIRSTGLNQAFRELYNQFNDTYDISHVGQVRTSDLAGAQNGRVVEFFQWPMDINSTWDTFWDGRTVQIQVASLNEESVTLEAFVGEERVVEYVYSAAAEWFQSASFYRNGTVVFGMQLTDFGTDWAGQFPAWTIEEVLALTHNGGPNAFSETFELGPEVTDVWLKLSASCAGPGSYTWATGPAQGLATDTPGGYSAQGDCPGREAHEDSIGIEPRENWGYVFQSSGNPFKLDVHILKRTLVLEDWAA